jgi:hypothetical protein
MKTASVQLANGAVYDSASVLATDEHHDLAILQIASFNLPVLNLGNSDALTIGEPLVVVGSPRGLNGTVTAGILSSVRDDGDGSKVIQTDTAVNPGNSGGPLLNNKAQAIGVVAFKLRSAEGLNFAIPVNYVRALLNALHGPMTLAQMQNTLRPKATPKAQNSRASSIQASLKETLDWLKQAIPLGGFEFHIHSNGTSYSTQKYMVPSIDSCNIEIDTVEDTTNSAGQKFRTTDNFTLFVGDLADSSVELSPRGFYLLQLESRRKTISWATSTVEIDSLGKHALADPGTEPSNWMPLYFSNESLANRVGAAFLHAADLCRKQGAF